MKTQEAKQIIDFNKNVYNDLRNYVESYLEWVDKNIPSGYVKYFGVCRFFKWHQFGGFLGFVYNGSEYTNMDHSGMYAHDFDCKYARTPNYIVLNFAKTIPTLLENGLKKLKDDGEAATEFLKNKIQFN